MGGTNQESSTEAYTLPCAKELVGCRCVIHGAQLCVLEGWDEGWRWEGSSREKGYMCIYIYIWLIQDVVQQNLIHHWKEIIFQ